MPRKRAITSARAVRAYVGHIAELAGFSKPWHAIVEICDARKEKPAHNDDPLCYCAAESQPQYHRVVIYIDLWHDGWKRERNWQETIRHELGHAFIASVVQFAAHAVSGNAIAEKALEDLDDELANRWATMPLWDKALSEVIL